MPNYTRTASHWMHIAIPSLTSFVISMLPQGIKEGLNAKRGAVEQLDYLYKECYKAGQSIYLFMDKYDHFTNKILSEPSCLDNYRSETHGTGYLRSFFDTVKAGTYMLSSVVL